jgi:hypothetical protein
VGIARREEAMIATLVLVEGDKVIEENLFIPLTDVDEVLVGSADGFGHLVHLVARSTSALDAAVRGLAAVPNVTGVLTLATKLSA